MRVAPAGLVIDASTVLTGVPDAVQDLVERTPPTDHRRLFEEIFVHGGLVTASAAERSLIDASRARLDAAADAIHEQLDRLAVEQRRLHETVAAQVQTGLEAIRREGKIAEEASLRAHKELLRGGADIAKAATDLHLTTTQVTDRVVSATEKVATAQATAAEAMSIGLRDGLKQLLNADDPTSAPALMKAVAEEAASKMRGDTEQNLAELRRSLEAVLGPEAPLARAIVASVQEVSDREIKRVQNQLDSLRSDVIVDRTRERHDPNFRGEGNEHDLAELLGPAAAVYGWTVDFTGTEVGDELRSKKGDLLLLGSSNEPIAAWEARARKNVSSREFFAGMKATARNRRSSIVVYAARTSADLPRGLGEFSRGRMPMLHKSLPDGTHVIVVVANPDDPAVAERLALAFWLISELHGRGDSLVTGDATAECIQRAVMGLAAIEQRLISVRMIKSGLTKSTREIDQVRSKVEVLESELRGDVGALREILCPTDGRTDAATDAIQRTTRTVSGPEATDAEQQAG